MRQKWIVGLSGLLALLVALPSSLAQAPGPFNEHEVKVQSNVQDKGDIWVLDFRFKDPRLVTVDIPGRGRKLCWYMWYQIINNTGQTHTPTLDFELVTLDKPGVYQDEEYGDQTRSAGQNTNSTVAGAQEQLARQGYYRGELDGVFGPETRRAIIRYQSDHGLSVTGRLNVDTLRALGLPRVASN